MARHSSTREPANGVGSVKRVLPIAPAGLIVGVVAMIIVALAVTWITSVPVVWALVLLATGLAALPFVVAIVRRQFDVFEPAYLFAVSYFVLFALRPAAVLFVSVGTPVFVGYGIEQTYAAALAIGAVGAAVFYVGYYLPVGRNLAQRLHLPREEWSNASLTVFIVLSLLLTGGAFSAFLLTNGGLSTLAAFLNGRNPVSGAALQQSSGYLYTAPLFLAPVGILVTSLSGQRWRVGAFVGLFLVALSQVLNIGTGDRSWTLPAIAALVLVWYLRRRARPGLPVIAIAVALTFLLGITLPRQYRNTEARSESLIQIVIDDILNPGQAVQDFLSREDTGMADGLAVELQFVPNTIDYQFGRTYLEAISRPVPRSLWAEKPRAAETQLMAVIWPQLARASVTFYFSVWGEPYLNFGLLGVIAVSLAFGIFWRSVYAWFRRRPTNRFVIAFYALSWPFIFVYMRGGIGADYQRQAIYLVPVVVAYLFIRRPASISRDVVPLGQAEPNWVRSS